MWEQMSLKKNISKALSINIQKWHVGDEKGREKTENKRFILYRYKQVNKCFNICWKH